jgi:preprotein translocase subunit Sec63
VLEVLPSVGDRPGSVEDLDTDDATIDAEALRERVRARSQLVDDGDYFAVLGVARDATGYEVRRAFLELRRAFDPSRMLTPEVADLAGDVRKITVVLEEAYEILKDTARRDRYRRAIEAVPGL